jgi:hypothetical protein
MNRRRRLVVALLLALVVGFVAVTVVNIMVPGPVPYVSGKNATFVVYGYVITSYYGTHEITANTTTNVAVYEISRVFATPKFGGVDISQDFNLDLSDVYITWNSQSGVIVYKARSWAFKAVLVETPNYYVLRPDFFNAGDVVACGAKASLPTAYAVLDLTTSGTTPNLYVVRTASSISCGSTVDTTFTTSDAATAIKTSSVPPSVTFQGKMASYSGSFRNPAVYYVQNMYVIAATASAPSTLYVYYK